MPTLATPLALVTDALSFAGPAAVHSLLAAGFRVIAVDRAFCDPSTRDEYQRQHPSTVALDEADTPHALVDEVIENDGLPEVIVSNDSHPAHHVAVEHARIGDLQATLNRLLVRPFLLAQALVPHLKQRGTGKLIFITSCRTALPQFGGAIPDIARAGANALVRSLSIELAPFGIPVNAIAPNYLYSEAYFPKAIYEETAAGRDFIQTTVPRGRLGTQEELAELITYLALMKGSFHTGTIIPFCGAWPMSPPRPF